MQREIVPSEKSSPTRYNSDANRQAVLSAALLIFSERGFDGASTRAIAAQAGLEQGHLAYYYPSKIALWQSVIEAFARDGEAYLRKHLTGCSFADPVAIAKSVLPSFLRSFAENPRLTRIMLQEFSVNSVRHDWVVTNFGMPVWHLVSPLFEQLQKCGALAGADPQIAYFSMVGAALITFGNPDLIDRINGGDGRRCVDDPDWIRRSIDHMLVPVLAPAH